MKSWLFGFTITIILLIIWHHQVHLSSPVLTTTLNTYSSQTVIRQWNVVAGYDNNDDAANLLARVNSLMIEFLRYLKDKYHIDEPDDVIADEGENHHTAMEFPGDTHEIVTQLLRNYNPDTFYENDPMTSSDTSYNINKGETMHLCLRNKSNPHILHDDNTILFVMLHESAHTANYNDVGHTVRFWEVFKFILYEAMQSGVYKPVDYSLNPINFCGLPVSYNPLFDTSVKNLWVLNG